MGLRFSHNAVFKELRLELKLLNRDLGLHIYWRNNYKIRVYTELKTLEWDILHPDRIINLEIKNERRTSNI